MNKVINLTVLVLCLFLASCGNKSEKDIETKMESGVVLIQNESFYEIELSNGETLYFTSYDEENGITGIATELDSVEVETSYGTGFFISENGEIATNAHVVSNTAEEKDMTRSMSKVLEALKQILVVAYQEYTEKYNQAARYCEFAYYSDEVSAADFYALRDIRDAIAQQLQEFSDIYDVLDDIDASQSTITYHNNVSIAYNNTHVTSSTDFTDCVVTKVDADHDLAILQLKDKKTPEDKYIFSVEDDDPFETYSLFEKIGTDKNSKLFMMGFNLGPSLAVTKEGIKAQFNSGTVSQQTSEHLMYSIPSLPGSSGSPVVNMKGQLVAINFAGLQNTQSFNYGIRVKYLKQLMEK